MSDAGLTFRRRLYENYPSGSDQQVSRSSQLTWYRHATTESAGFRRPLPTSFRCIASSRQQFSHGRVDLGVNAAVDSGATLVFTRDLPGSLDPLSVLGVLSVMGLGKAANSTVVLFQIVFGTGNGRERKDSTKKNRYRNKPSKGAKSRGINSDNAENTFPRIIMSILFMMTRQVILIVKDSHPTNTTVDFHLSVTGIVLSARINIGAHKL